LHPNVIKLLEQQDSSLGDNIKNIKFAFKNLEKGQTLLINLTHPVKIIPVDSMNTADDLTVSKIKSVIIGDSNSVVVYVPEYKYGKNNNNDENNSYPYPSVNNNSKEENQLLEPNSAYVVRAGSNSDADWNASLMATPPGIQAGIAIAEPAPSANGSPTQIETQIEI
jgi:hypothetical protein